MCMWTIKMPVSHIPNTFNMAKLRKHSKELLVLAKARPALVHQIIQPAKRDLIDALSEGAFNVIKGVVPLTPPLKRKLRNTKKGYGLSLSGGKV